VQRGVCSHRSRPSRLPSVRNGAQRSRARPVWARRLPCLVCKLQTLRSSGFQGRNRRHTYASELLRAGVGLPALMNLLGHVDPDMTMRYLNVTLTDLKQEFQLARSEPRHLMPRANPSVAPFRVGLAGVTDVLSGAHHVLEMFRRTLPDGPTRSSLDRLSNRLTKITPSQRASAPAKPGQRLAVKARPSGLGRFLITEAHLRVKFSLLGPRGTLEFLHSVPQGKSKPSSTADSGYRRVRPICMSRANLSSATSRPLRLLNGWEFPMLPSGAGPKPDQSPRRHALKLKHSEPADRRRRRAVRVDFTKKNARGLVVFQRHCQWLGAQEA
jgi:hypothetical protein